jgi:Beta-ketoacyl synthase, N-terminal domain
MRTLYVESVAFWAPGLPGWGAARAAFRGEGGCLEPALARPAPELLAPTQRRRAPDTVVLALEVAARAVADAGLQATQLPSVFVSAHGDLAITDDMCKTLAEAPTLVSPTRFHNSVHNAASGYWTMASGCTQASTALAAFESSFAAGLLEAATQSAADACPVLLVGYDVEARGALKSVTRSRGLLSAALVLAPQRSERSLATLAWSLQPGPAVACALRSEAARGLAHNALADALPLLESLASRPPETLLMPLSALLSLKIELGPL